MADYPIDWAVRAACRDVDPSVFFPGKGSQPNRSKYAPAKAICDACPVIIECHDSAMSAERGDPDDIRAGMFAGLKPRERARLDPTASLHYIPVPRRAA